MPYLLGRGPIDLSKPVPAPAPRVLGGEAAEARLRLDPTVLVDPAAAGLAKRIFEAVISLQRTPVLLAESLRAHRAAFPADFLDLAPVEAVETGLASGERAEAERKRREAELQRTLELRQRQDRLSLARRQLQGQFQSLARDTGEVAEYLRRLLREAVPSVGGGSLPEQQLEELRLQRAWGRAREVLDRATDPVEMVAAVALVCGRTPELLKAAQYRAFLEELPLYVEGRGLGEALPAALATAAGLLMSPTARLLQEVSPQIEAGCQRVLEALDLAQREAKGDFPGLTRPESLPSWHSCEVLPIEAPVPELPSTPCSAPSGEARPPRSSRARERVRQPAAA